MDFVDKQNGVFGVGQLFEYGFDAGFEVAAVFGAGQKGAHVEGENGAAGQGFGDVAVNQPVGQAFGERGFAHAGFAHQQRVVLRRRHRVCSRRSISA